MINSETLFIGILIFKCTSLNKADFQPTFEETTLLIQAESLEEATQKAHQHGESKNRVYEGGYGNILKVKLINVEDVNYVLEWTDNDVNEINARYFLDFEAYSTFRELLRKGE